MLEVRTRAARSMALWRAEAPVDVVRDRLLNEIAQSSRAQLMTSTDDAIEVSVQGNAFSWGERVTVTLTSTIGGTSVAVATRPVMPFTLFDWGEGERDIRLLYAVSQGIDGGSDQRPVVGGVPVRLGRTSRRSKPIGWLVVAVAGLMLVLALVNMVVNTEHIGSWLPLLIIMSFALIVTLRDLRRR